MSEIQNVDKIFDPRRLS